MFVLWQKAIHFDPALGNHRFQSRGRTWPQALGAALLVVASGCEWRLDAVRSTPVDTDPLPSASTSLPVRANGGEKIAFAATSAAAPPLVCPAYDESKVAGALPLQSVGDTQVGGVSGAFSVGADGAANYSIPLVPIPGPGGMTPALSLNYSSRNGNGLLGVGFALSAVDAISRCTKPDFQGLELDERDKFCLGNLPLVAMSGTYGADGTVYRTDPETYTKVTSFGDDQGPVYFEVRSKDGLIHTYGLDHVGGTDKIGSVRKSWWHIYTQDRLGNKVEYEYDAPIATLPNGINYNAERRLSNIRYGSNNSETFDRKIKFSYESRPDQTESYADGVSHPLTQRLWKIEMQRLVGGSFANARSYTLSYYNAGPTGRSKLQSVKECGIVDTACLPPTTLEWNEGAEGWAGAVTVANGRAPKKLEEALIPYDIFGDGADEVIYQFDFNGPDVAGAGAWSVQSAAAPFPVDGILDGEASKDPYAVYPIDYDLDGVLDLLAIDSPPQELSPTPSVNITPWRVLLSKSELRPINTVFKGPINQRYLPGSARGREGQFVDLNGDGLQDAFQYFPVAIGEGQQTPRWEYRLRTGLVADFVQQPFPGPGTEDLAFGSPRFIGELTFVAPEQLFVLDREGDGRTDIYFVQTIFDGPDEPPPDCAAAAPARPPPVDCGQAVGDTNPELQSLEIGDLASFQDPDDNIEPNHKIRPTGLPVWIMAGNSSLGTGVKRLFLDFNGDGLTDLLTNAGSPGEVPPAHVQDRFLRKLYLWVNTGRGFSGPRLVFHNTGNVPFDLHHAVAVDANGDGHADLLAPNTHGFVPPEGGSATFKANRLHLLRAPTSTTGNAQFTLVQDVASFQFHNLVSFPSDPSEGPIEMYPDGITSTYLSTQGPRLLDADGDGLEDLVYVNIETTFNPNATPKLQRRQALQYRSHAMPGVVPDSLARIKEGINPSISTVAISYTPLSSLSDDPAVYERGTCDNEHYTCTTHPYYVVSKVERDAGLNGAASGTRLVSEYAYKNSITHKKAREWLGFAEQRIKSYPSDGSQPAVITRNFYSNTEFRHDPRLRESWTYSTLPDGTPWLERNIKTWDQQDTVIPCQNQPGFACTIYYDYVKANETWSYRFGTSLNVAQIDGLRSTTDLDAYNDQFRTLTVVHDNVLGLDHYGNVTKRRSFVSPGSYQTFVDTSYLPVNESDWLLSRPKTVTSYQIQANCGTNSDCIKATQRTTEVTAYVQIGSAPTALPQSVKTYHTADDPGPTTETSYRYDPFGNITHTAVKGAVDQQGTLVTRETCTTYDPDGVFPHAMRNALGHTGYVKTDPLLGVPLVAVDPSGRRSLVQYDQLGRAVKTRSPSGVETTASYFVESRDGLQLARLIHNGADGLTTETVLDRLGRAIIERADGFNNFARVRTRVFDAAGKLQREDAHAVGAGDPPPPQVNYTYDVLGRKLTQTEPNDTDPAQPYVRRWDYDDVHRYVTYTDTRGHVTQKQYSIEGFLGRTIEAQGTADEVTRIYAYGPYGRLQSSQVLDRPNTLSQYTYDDRGNVLTAQDPERGKTTFSYNAFNEPLFNEDENDRQSVPVYDVLGRVDTLTVKDASVSPAKLMSFTGYSYDTEAASPNNPQYGKLTRVLRDDYVSITAAGAKQTTSVDYDYQDAPTTLGQLSIIKHTVPSDITPGTSLSYSFTYDYDPLDRVKSLTYPLLPTQTAANKVGYNYAASNGQLESIDRIEGATTTRLWTLSGTDAANRPTSFSSGDDISTTRLYDWRGNLTFQYLQTGNETTAGGGCAFCTRGSMKYLYDGEGNLVVRGDDFQNAQVAAAEHFVYDALDRLRSSGPSLDLQTENWDYDPLGNLTSNTYRGIYTYGDPNRPMRVTQVAGGQVGTTRSYGYDNVGNQTTRPGGSVVYNEMNLPARMLGTTKVKTAEFLYGAGGGRVRKITGSGANHVSTTYIGGLYEQIRQGGRVEHRLIVPGVAVLPYGQSGNTLSKQAARFIHPDHLGSTQTVTADDAPAGSTSHKAVVKEIRSYDAFGKTRNPDWTPISYTGVERALVTAGYTGHDDDPELGLIDMGGRVYDPTLARFLTPDPSVPEPGRTQAWNPYAYVINNPLRHTDPSGFNYCVPTQVGNGVTWGCSYPGGGGGLYDSRTLNGLTITGVGVDHHAPSRAELKFVLSQYHEKKGAPNGNYPNTQSNNLGPGIAKGGVQVAENTMSGVGSDANADTRTADEIMAQECGPGGMYCADEVTIRAPLGGGAEPRSYPASPSDARARELAREVSKAWQERGGELIEKAAWGEMKALEAIWQAIAFQPVFRLGGTVADAVKRVTATTAPGMRLKTGIWAGAGQGAGGAVTRTAGQIRSEFIATVGNDTARLIAKVVGQREPISALTTAQRTLGATHYREVANATVGKFASEAARYNIARAEFLEGTRKTLSPTLPEFIANGFK